MRYRLPVFVLAGALGAAGLMTTACGSDEAVEHEADVAWAPEELDAAELGRLGARLHEEPEEAEEILAERGLEWEEYEEAVRRVAADVDQAREYEEAFLAAGGEAADASGTLLAEADQP